MVKSLAELAGVIHLPKHPTPRQIVAALAEAARVAPTLDDQLRILAELRLWLGTAGLMPDQPLAAPPSDAR